MRYRIVDVFTDRPLAGNALCVVTDECPESLMQAIARETNLSETTFVTARGAGTYSMRIFTPGVELPFAGHPTLGTAFVLGAGRWRQTTSGGEVTVVADGDGAEMVQPDPEITAVDDPGVPVALGLGGDAPVWVATAAGNTHVVTAVEGGVAGVRADAPAVLAILDRHRATTLAVVAPIDERTLHVRVHFRANPLAEDPGTGSAAGPVALIARARWDLATDLVIHQGDEIGRPSRIRVHAEMGDLRVGGGVVQVAEGRLSL